MSEQISDHVLDTTGLLCPEPVMLLHNSIRDASHGEVIKVIATDPSTQRDIPKFCEFLGHELVSDSQENELYLYWIRKDQPD
ncbi:MAG: sulfurtransferase TusA [Pseudomonadales bacterium]